MPKAEDVAPPVSDAKVFLEVPALNLGEKAIAHHGYRFLFDRKNNLPRWVAYSLNPQKVKSKVVPASGAFHVDGAIAGSAKPADYEGSGFEKGALVPAEDMRFSKEAVEDSYYLTTVVPVRGRFNRGLWKRLEAQVRKWSEKYDDIYVVSGPILDGKCVATIGKNICAPAKLFKVVMARFNHELIAIGFIVPQGFSQVDLKKYAVSVDKVEAATGIDFFPAVQADTQERIESFEDLSAWH